MTILPAQEIRTAIHPTPPGDPFLPAFESGEAWTHDVRNAENSPARQLQAARTAFQRHDLHEATEKYFRLVRRYPDAPQAIPGLLESAQLLLYLGHPTHAAFALDQANRRQPEGPLSHFDLFGMKNVHRGAVLLPEADVTVQIAVLEAATSVTLLEAERLGYDEETHGAINFWPFSMTRGPEDRDPFRNPVESLFPEYRPIQLNKQHRRTAWIPGASFLDLITEAFDADHHARRHLNAMITLDPLSPKINSAFFHRGRLNLVQEEYKFALDDFSLLSKNFALHQQTSFSANEEDDIAVLGELYLAWTHLLEEPQVWKDYRVDEKAKQALANAHDKINKLNLLQLMPVMNNLVGRLDRRLAHRYERMAAHYTRNGFAASGELIRHYLRIDAPRTEAATKSIPKNPWQ